jgi:hypothetical protein
MYQWQERRMIILRQSYGDAHYAMQDLNKLAAFNDKMAGVTMPIMAKSINEKTQLIARQTLEIWTVTVFPYLAELKTRKSSIHRLSARA